MVATDARYRTKVYLDTYITDANLTDDTPAALTNTVMYAYPPYPLELIFSDDYAGFGVVFFVDKPTSKARYSSSKSVYAYEESIPVHCHVMTKTNLTPELTLWKAETELRTILQTYPFAAEVSVREYGTVQTHTIKEGSTVFYGFTFTLSYLRDITS